MLRLIFIISTITSGIWCLVIPDNPCSDVFTYRQQRGVYYGEITVPYDGNKVLDLTVNISMVGVYQNLKLRLDLMTSTEKLLSSSFIRYRVHFPLQNVIPKITQITFNGRTYCYGPAELLGSGGVTNLWSNLVYKINQYTYTIQNGIKEPEISSSTTIRSVTSHAVSNRESCGIANDVQTLVLKGEKTIENEYPWLVAMFHRQGVSYEFQCTANLISNRHVVTAAHCVWYYKAPLIEKEDILLILGRSDISRWASTGALIRTALDVIPHPNYKQDSGHCDVAIIKLNEEVPFKNTVRPICLWDGDTNLKHIVNDKGVVAGWGKSDNGRQTVSIPRKVNMPVVSQETCLRSNLGFKNITSDMTFCAGNRDGSGPCSGDSGAGLIIKQNGKWFLRGLVSTSIKNQDYSCNLNEYIVFADMAKLKDWIKSALK